MKLEIYRTATEFLARTQAFLEEEEALNNLLLGNAMRVAGQEGTVQTNAFWASVEGDGDTLLAAGMTPPYTVVAHAKYIEPEAARLLVEGMLNNPLPIPGVFCGAELSRRLANILMQRTGREMKLNMSARAHVLTQVDAPREVPGTLRQAEPQDEDLITQWLYAFNQEIDEMISREHCAEMTHAGIEKGEFFLWEKEDPVSMAKKTRKTRHGIAITGVYTPPELRGCGYASAGVAALSQLALAQGFRFSMLFTDVGNPISNKIYTRMGYRPIGDFERYVFVEKTAQ